MNSNTRKNTQAISIKIEGTGSRKLIRNSLRRIAQVLRTSSNFDLPMGWDDEPVKVEIKLLDERRIDF